MSGSSPVELLPPSASRQSDADRPDDAFGREDHDDDEGDAERRRPSLRIAAYGIPHHDDGRRAHEPAEQRADPTDDRHQKTLHGLGECDRRRAHEIVVIGIKLASDSGKKAGYGEPDEQVKRHVIAKALHAALAIANAAHREAERRT